MPNQRHSLSVGYPALPLSRPVANDRLLLGSAPEADQRPVPWRFTDWLHSQSVADSSDAAKRRSDRGL